MAPRIIGVIHSTGTCFIQKIYVPSSSLLQGKYLPFSPSPLRLNIFCLFVILSLTQLYRYTHWNGYSHFRSGLNWFRKFLKRGFKNQMSVVWSWTYFYNLHWNNYLYFKGLLYIWEEMIMMALLHMAGLENSECIWKIHRKPEVIVSVSMTEK